MDAVHIAALGIFIAPVVLLIISIAAIISIYKLKKQKNQIKILELQKTILEMDREKLVSSETASLDGISKNQNIVRTHYMKQLSNREVEVVEAVLAGNKRYKEIAGNLNISVNTVKFHLKNIYQVTGASDISGLLLLFNGYASSL